MHRRTRIRLFLLGTAFLCLTMAGNGQTVSLSGRITDASTGEPLGAAVLRVRGTSRGTIANAAGEYRLSLGQGRWSVVFSYLGYASDTLRIELKADTVGNVSLQPRPIPLGEVVVTGEDPAVGIMRKVIENKKRWQEALHSYRFEAFTRQIVRRDTAIAQITESYTTGYWQWGDTLREVIKQRRQTNNVLNGQNFAAVGNIINFYDDDIRFVGFTFVGPTSPDAFEEYDFKLDGSRLVDSREVFIISLLPRSRVTPLFRGKIRVTDVEFALVGVDVTPNEAFALPLLEAYELSYGQQFEHVEGRYWLPVDIRVRGRFTVGLPGLTIPPIGFESNSSLYDYAVNVPIPDSVAHQPRRLVLKESGSIDSAFWRSHEVLPLTIEERSAYATLDSNQTLDRQFRPTGLLAALGDGRSSFLEVLDVRYNRVQGWFVGGNARQDSVIGTVGVFARAGYGIADKRWGWRFGVEVPGDERRSWTVHANAFDIMTKESERDPILSILTSSSAVTSKSDHWDYYYRRGWLMGVEARLARTLLATLDYSRARELSAEKHTDWSLLYSGERFRANPPADEGIVSSLNLRGTLGRESLFGLNRTNHLEVEIERGGGGLGGDFTFTRAAIRGEWHMETFLRRTLFPAVLSVRMIADAGWGGLPRQRLFALPSSHTDTFDPLGLFQAAKGREFTGDRSIGVFVEQNLRSLLYAAAGLPFLYRRSMDFVVFIHAGRTWATNSRLRAFSSNPDVWYSEAGAGIGRILGLFRLDVARRFTAPARWQLTASLSQLL